MLYLVRDRNGAKFKNYKGMINMYGEKMEYLLGKSRRKEIIIIYKLVWK